MVTTKPIKIDDEVKKTLDDMKKYPRETYNDTLRRILKLKIITDHKSKKSQLSASRERMAIRAERLNEHLSKLRGLKNEVRNKV